MEVPDPQGWYLNLQLPANCSGNAIGYNAYPRYFGNGNPGHTLTVAMWTPTGLTSYQKVIEPVRIVMVSDFPSSIDCWK